MEPHNDGWLYSGSAYERLSNKSVIDFAYMFFSNIIKKVFGFVREIVLAFFFGSSLAYANFLLLKTAADLFSQLTQGSALQASLLPKFSNIYSKKEKVSLVCGIISLLRIDQPIT